MSEPEETAANKSFSVVGVSLSSQAARPFIFNIGHGRMRQKPPPHPLGSRSDTFQPLANRSDRRAPRYMLARGGRMLFRVDYFGQQVDPVSNSSPK
jgi:hypothetical protein